MTISVITAFGSHRISSQVLNIEINLQNIGSSADTPPGTPLSFVLWKQNSKNNDKVTVKSH